MVIDRTLRARQILAGPIALLALATVGCGSSGSAPPQIVASGPAAPDAVGETLRIATANLWGVSVLGFDWADAIDARFQAMAERLAENEPELDIVLVQEAWKDSARRALLSHPGVAERFPYRVDVVERPGGSGLVVLSRFPLLQARFHRYRAQGNCLRFWEGDCLSGKGLLVVEARLGNRAVWLANTHLIACYARDPDRPTACDEEDPNGLDRWHQLTEAEEVLAGLVGDAPVLIGGDFNFVRVSRYYASITDAPDGWIEPGQVDAGDGATRAGVDFLWSRPGRFLRWHALGPTRPIFRAPVELSAGKSVALSDHPVLAAEFCLVRLDDPDASCLSPPTSDGNGL